MSGWDIKLDGVSIKHQVAVATLHKGKGLFCKELTLELKDKDFLDQFDFTQIPASPRIEALTEVDGNWQSEGTFFAEEPGTITDKNKIVHTLYGRDESAQLTFPFSTRKSKEWSEETTLFVIFQENIEEAGLDYDEARMLINDYTIYPNSYSVTDFYLLDINQELAGKTDGFLYTDRLGRIWILKDEYSWDPVEVEIHAGQIQNITKHVEHPEFGNRIKVGSYSKKNDANVSISLEMTSSYVACGEGVAAKAVVTHLDGAPVADGYPVDWTSDNNSYAAWQHARTHVYTHRITNEAQEATSLRAVFTSYPIRQVHSVTEVRTGLTKTVKEFKGRSITLDESTPLDYTDSVVRIDYETGYAVNTLIAGSIGEVEVPVHAIVETFVRDTQTIRIDTSSGEATAEQAAYITIVTKDFITDEVITDPGNVRLDDVLEGATVDGVIDLGLVSGGKHDISVRDVSGYKDTDLPDGLANDTIRVGQTVYVTSDDEETTNPNIITVHNDLDSIQGGTTGQRYHLTAAELAALSTYATTTQVNSLISAHAALDTNVHGAGADTLATDADITAAIAAHAALADPHTGYRLESADHTHQSSGLQGGKLDHGLAMTGLTDDDHSQYLLLAGRSGGQTGYGGTDAGDDLILYSTSNGTKGNILIGASSLLVVDEVNDCVGIGNATVPASTKFYVELNGTGQYYHYWGYNTNAYGGATLRLQAGSRYNLFGQYGQSRTGTHSTGLSRASLAFWETLNNIVFVAGHNSAKIVFAYSSGTVRQVIDQYGVRIGEGIGSAATWLEVEETETLAANANDGYAACITLDPGYTGAYTVTRHNYMDINDVSLAGGAAVTDAAVMRFDAAIGTHKAVLAAFQTTDSNGDTTDWTSGIIVNHNGVLHKIPTVLV